MIGDSKLAELGMTAVHRSGDTTKLVARRRIGPSGWPSGWRLQDRSGGLSDVALDSDDWVLLTPERLATLFAPDEVDGEQQ